MGVLWWFFAGVWLDVLGWCYLAMRILSFYGLGTWSRWYEGVFSMVITGADFSDMG